MSRWLEDLSDMRLVWRHGADRASEYLPVPAMATLQRLLERCLKQAGGIDRLMPRHED